MTRDMIQAALADAKALIQKLQAMLKEHDEQKTGVRTEMKRPNGRLTDAGVAALRVMVDAGRLDSEIARDLGITPAAAGNQRAKYKAERMNTKGRRRAA